jgi:chromate transporter
MIGGNQSGARITTDVPDLPADDSDREARVAGPRPISALILARLFLQIGATSFGGLGPSLAIIERELVDRRPILAAVDVSEAVAATRLLADPGGVLPRLPDPGLEGPVIATVAFMLPPAIAMLRLAVFSQSLPSQRALSRAAQGVTPAVVGLRLATMCRFGRTTIDGPVALGIGLATFGAASLLRVPAAMVVVAAGLIGVPILSAPGTEGAGHPRRGGRS